MNEHDKSSNQKSGFWNTLPGILAGVAGIISAVAALIVGLNQAGLIGTSHTTPPPKNSISEPEKSQPAFRSSPTQFMRDYYTKINEDKIGEAWQYLTQNFQGNSSSNYSDFYNWWNRVDEVQVKDVSLISQDNERAIVEVRTGYLMSGELREETPQQFTLIWNENIDNWQIDDRVKL
jgi:hypothetical protein